MKESRQRKNLNGTVWILENSASGDRAEIWPASGFNCFRWLANGCEWLYTDADFFNGSPPTRSGNPILFPFPNRIRDGRFSWDGKTYELPINDPAKKNAIHGFVCYRPWRVIEDGTEQNSAWITGEFHAETDGKDCASLWPCDYILRVTYRLVSGALITQAVVTNPDSKPLPFGLGYHPYFVVADDAKIRVPAQQYWELHETLPTGKRLTVDASRDLRQSRQYSDLKLDDVLTELESSADVMRLLGRIDRGDAGTLAIRGNSNFREMVVFTPPHRQAICLEPYTCVTDAINMRHADTGWKTLEPGGQWETTLEWRVT